MTQPDKPSYFTLTTDDDCVVVSFHRTQFTDEDNLERLGEELFALVEQQQYRRVILNLALVRYVTSSVLGKWISLHRKLVRHDGRLILCQTQPEVREILEASRLLTYFHTADTVDAAREQLDD